jgi:hypothetical protein
MKTLTVAMSGCVAVVAHVDGPNLHVASTGEAAELHHQVLTFLWSLLVRLLDVTNRSHRSCGLYRSAAEHLQVPTFMWPLQVRMLNVTTRS